MDPKSLLGILKSFNDVEINCVLIKQHVHVRHHVISQYHVKFYSPLAAFIHLYNPMTSLHQVLLFSIAIK